MTLGMKRPCDHICFPAHLEISQTIGGKNVFRQPFKDLELLSRSQLSKWSHLVRDVIRNDVNKNSLDISKK